MVEYQEINRHAEGRVPIELVDGARLVQPMERMELGVTPRTVYDVGGRFFTEYRATGSPK